jgi:hypothetical protein
MKLINTDGLALIGPGSEWFWTALSGLILAVTFIAIYRQLRLQRNAATIAQVESLTMEWSSERMNRAILTFLLAVEAGVEPGDIPEAPLFVIGDFFEKMAYLVRMRTVDVRLLHENLSPQVQAWWARMRPTVLAWRERPGDRDVYTSVEELTAIMARMDVARGWSFRTDGEYLATRLPGLIAQVRGNLEIHEALRAVPIQFTSVPVPVSIVRDAR